MADVSGFWSYVRDDDDAEAGRIRRLAERIRTEYAMLTGEEIDVFLDREDIKWGEEWRRRIDEALAGTAFFIPVVTPRYFMSTECRRELLTFAGHAASLGVEELLLPLLYVDVPDFGSESADEAVALIARTQYVNWTVLRLAAEDSAEYRSGVHALAKRLAEIGASLAEQLPTQVVAAASPDVDGDEDDDAPGFGDILASSEDAFPRWQATIEALTPVTEEMGALAEQAAIATHVSDERGGGFAGRLRVAAEYARALDDPAIRFLDLATSYASDLVTIDAGMLTLIRLASAGSESDEERRMVCEMFANLRALAEVSRRNSELMRDFSQTVDETAAFSREIRPPVRKLQAGLQRLMDGQSVMDEWVRQMDASGIDCSDVATVEIAT